MQVDEQYLCEEALEEETEEVVMVMEVAEEENVMLQRKW